MPPAARITDMHTCPMVTGLVPHVGGPIVKGAPTVLTGALPQARVGDMLTCVGPPDVIVKGSATVLVNSMPAARLGDNTAHGGVIVVGLPTVIIGDSGGGGGGGSGGVGSSGQATAMLSEAMIGSAFSAAAFNNLPQARALISAAKNGMPFCERCAAVGGSDAPSGLADTMKQWWQRFAGSAPVTPARNGEPGADFQKFVKEVNPGGGTINCGNIIDANYKRITGVDATATAPTAQDGSWTEIEDRYNTTLNKGKSFQDAFDVVKKGGNGTVAVVKILYSDPTVSHVVILANDRGSVGILEGQGGGQYITTASAANRIYNSDGGTRVNYGIVPSGTKLP